MASSEPSPDQITENDELDDINFPSVRSAVHSLEHVLGVLDCDIDDGLCFIDLLPHVDKINTVNSLRCTGGMLSDYDAVDFNRYAADILCWVSKPRSPGEFAAVAKLPCRCDDQNSADHLDGRVKFEASGHLWPSMSFVASLLYTIDPFLWDAMKFTQGRLDKIAKRACFPTRIEDILPYRPEDTLHGLLN
jgi:hypothetical protein